jgi:hypothetical protein
MPGKILLSTAYLPPAEYFSLIRDADEIFIEREENYVKQSYRNRCSILSTHGQHQLSVPVFEGSIHKVPIRDARIDYSKRWQQVHLRAIMASYRSAPFYQYYYEEIERILLRNNIFLLDLNDALLRSVLKMLRIEKEIKYTEKFEPCNEEVYDYRYRISPKKETPYISKRYIQVFDEGQGFTSNLSIIDLIFNLGPEAAGYL